MNRSPVTIDEDDAEVWEVAEIVNATTVKGVVQCRVRCDGCTDLEDTWEIMDHLYNNAVKLQELPQKFPRKLPDAWEV